MPSPTEENYLKCIFKLSEKANEQVTTNAIAAEMNTAAASVTDMLKKLSEKKYIVYERYKGVNLTSEGETEAVKLIRKHRLWEVFLVDKLGFSWEEVHDIAEELEHISSHLLIEKLEAFLDFPLFDPHGDPIPDRNLVFRKRSEMLLSDLKQGQKGILVGVNDHSTPFLQYLNKLEINLGTELTVIDKVDYDRSMIMKIQGNRQITISHQVSKNLYVKPL